MSHDEIIEQSAQVLSTLTTCDGHPWATELHRRQARALAEAGLLAQPLPTREQIASQVASAMDASWDDAMEYTALPSAAADAVLALLKGQDA